MEQLARQDRPRPIRNSGRRRGPLCAEKDGGKKLELKEDAQLNRLSLAKMLGY